MKQKEERKNRKNGNSYILTIPPALIESLELKEGDSVQLVYKNNHIELTKQEPDIVNDEFIQMVYSIYEVHQETFKILVDK